MPLLLMTGIPSSGKSRRANEIKDYFENVKNKKVYSVSENILCKEPKNIVYNDSLREKTLRSSLKTEVLRKINESDITIIDGLNYIKGFRYELFCIAKKHKTTYCICKCLTPITVAKEWNGSRPAADQYDNDVFDALVYRFEDCDPQNRWDSPLISVQPEMATPFNKLYDALYEMNPLSQNQSTEIQPLSSNNYIYELNKCTQDVIDAILLAQKLTHGEVVKIPDIEDTLNLNRKVSLPELSRSRRQFIIYSKSHPINDFQKIKSLFIQYLNTTLDT